MNATTNATARAHNQSYPSIWAIKLAHRTRSLLTNALANTPSGSPNYQTLASNLLRVNAWLGNLHAGRQKD